MMMLEHKIITEKAEKTKYLFVTFLYSLKTGNMVRQYWIQGGTLIRKGCWK